MGKGSQALEVAGLSMPTMLALAHHVSERSSYSKLQRKRRMSQITSNDAWLHNEDGTHKSTPDSTNGTVLATFEQAIARHLDRHVEQGDEVIQMVFCVTCHTEIIETSPGNGEWIHASPIDPEQPFYCHPDQPGNHFVAEPPETDTEEE